MCMRQTLTGCSLLMQLIALLSPLDATHRKLRPEGFEHPAFFYGKTQIFQQRGAPSGARVG
jgi:hypothetical protein